MAIGYLILQARTAHDAVPLSGVRIKILDPLGNNVYKLSTDENGETQKIPLETLSRDFSLNPYFTELPYISYNVRALADGFHSLFVSDIPIYEGETAILPLTLIPMETNRRNALQTEISVGKPAVAMDKPRHQEGMPQGNYVLRQVVIPNPITVHLGSPSSSASNVRVSFPDYIKNVASSEIYPTWPEASLRANIYAIITFALNRVYTEWYRSRSYNFDITNNTAYDQYFVYGRPIYDSISRIVDEIFNEYVRRKGQNNPYFTSFCNGTTATCQGLSQWGTVSLAEQGMTPIGILRSYYPKDIEIAQTDIITGMLSSYPETPLKLGSRGLNVQTIQTYLNRIRKNYPAIPKITDETGVFGKSTQDAVKKFQSVFHLASDGIVGKSTWYKISSLYTAVTRLAELNGEGETLGIGTVPPDSLLRQGSRGQGVIILQYLLNVISEYYVGVPAPAQDGIFGSQTAQAVSAFQRIMRLNPDGIVGPLTWNALYEAYRGIEQNIPSFGPDQGTIEYIVQAGDTLWAIARKYGTTVDVLKSLNGLDSDLLRIGQKLKVPVSQSAPSYTEYTVQSGDTLWSLAKRYHTTVDAIKQLNNLSSDLLRIGQILKIPENR